MKYWTVTVQSVLMGKIVNRYKAGAPICWIIYLISMVRVSRRLVSLVTDSFGPQPHQSLGPRPASWDVHGRYCMSSRQRRSTRLIAEGSIAHESRAMFSAPQSDSSVYRKSSQSIYYNCTLGDMWHQAASWVTLNKQQHDCQKGLDVEGLRTLCIYCPLLLLEMLEKHKATAL